MQTTLAALSVALRERHQLADAAFDAMYPPEWRVPSARFWSPVAIARRAAEWLTEGGADEVLDVGSGVGKMCLVGALTTRSRFVGLEHRASLVQTAQAAASRLGVAERATFVCDTVARFDFTRFSALYLFNPFGEHLADEPSWLDASVSHGEAPFRQDVGVMERALDGLPVGARLVTYHGMGGRIPDTYRLEQAERVGTDILRLWVKRRRVGRGHYMETPRGTRSTDALHVTKTLEDRLWGDAPNGRRVARQGSARKYPR